MVKLDDLSKENAHYDKLDQIEKVGKAANKLTDIQWILDRFTH